MGRVHGDSSIERNRRTMIKIAIVVCLAALAAAEAEADAFYHPYQYSNWGYNWNWNHNNWNNMNKNNWPMMSGYRRMNDMNGHEAHRFQSYGKRSADAEAWYQPYSNWGYNWNRPYYYFSNYRYHF